jgi:hypothetical protein
VNCFSFRAPFLALSFLSIAFATACPFCQLLEESTLVDLIDENGVVIVAKLTAPSMNAAERMRLSLRNKDQAQAAVSATLTAETVLKGSDALAAGDTITVPVLMPGPAGSIHLIFAPSPETLTWTAPVPLSSEAITFIAKYHDLPPLDRDADADAQATRLAFFLPYLHHEDSTLETAAYGEFAKSPYEAISKMAPHFDAAALLEWIRDEDAPIDRRRLFLTLLGTCGSKKEADVLDQWLRDPDDRHSVGADALAACYLRLRGEAGLALIDEVMLSSPNPSKEPDSDDVFAALAALEFHAFQAPGNIPRERLIESFRLALDHPNSADLVIPDLALLGDWESIPRLVTLFKTHGEEFAWIKEPVILFLRTCPLPEAATQLRELAKLDPQLVENTEGKYTAEDLWGPGAQ